MVATMRTTRTTAMAAFGRERQRQPHNANSKEKNTCCCCRFSFSSPCCHAASLSDGPRLLRGPFQAIPSLPRDAQQGAPAQTIRRFTGILSFSRPKTCPSSSFSLPSTRKSMGEKQPSNEATSQKTQIGTRTTLKKKTPARVLSARTKTKAPTTKNPDLSRRSVPLSLSHSLTLSVFERRVLRSVSIVPSIRPPPSSWRQDPPQCFSPSRQDNNIWTR